MTCLSGSGGEVASGGSVVGSSRDLERHVSVEEAEQHWRGELEQMRRELDTLKESLKDQDQVDSEEVRWIAVHELLVIYMLVVLELWSRGKRQMQWVWQGHLLW